MNAHQTIQKKIAEIASPQIDREPQAHRGDNGDRETSGYCN